MAEENNDKDAVPEDRELQSGDVMVCVETVESPAKEASDNIIYQMKMEPGIVAEEEADKLADGTTDVTTKDEGGNLSVNEFGEGLALNNSPTAETTFSGGQLRKKPALVVVGSNHKFNVRSRYLSDSAGSCHDYCKYGHKHESEKKTNRFMLGTIREAQTVKRTTSDDLEKCVLDRMTKKKELHRRLSLPGPIPEKGPLMKTEVKNVLKKDVKEPKMKRVQSEIKPCSVSSPGTSSRSKTDIEATGKIVTQRSNLLKKSTEKVKKIKVWKEVGSHSKGEKVVKAKEPICDSPETSLKKEVGHSTGIKNIKVREPMSNSPKTPLKKSPSLKARLYKDHKSSSRSKNQINPEEGKVDGHDDVHEKTLYMIEPNSIMKPERKTSTTIISGESPHYSRSQRSKGNRNGNVASSLLSSSSKESARPQRAHKQGLNATKNKQTGIIAEDAEPKTSASRAKPTVNRRVKNLDFKNTKQIDQPREDGRLKSNTSRSKSTVDHKLKPKRTDKNHSEEKDVSAWKVKFKRGTVVALQVANNAPKKLRFKRRSLGEDQHAKGEVDRKSKTECNIDNEPHDTESGPEKVRLRHQEASEKKDDVDLNNVIEETASKLVKTRKSKVKALVGAFETVMSLRDRKHLVDTGAS